MMKHKKWARGKEQGQAHRVIRAIRRHDMIRAPVLDRLSIRVKVKWQKTKI